MNAKWFFALPLVGLLRVVAQAQTTLVGTNRLNVWREQRRHPLLHVLLY